MAKIMSHKGKSYQVQILIMNHNFQMNGFMSVKNITKCFMTYFNHLQNFALTQFFIIIARYETAIGLSTCG